MRTTDYAWATSAPVQAALKAVGESDGTPEWTFRFAERILQETDRIERLRAQGMDEMLKAVAAWRYHVATHDVQSPTTVPTKIPRMLLTKEIEGRTMDFAHCAWLLGCSEDKLEQLMWRSHERLREEAPLVMSGQKTVLELRKGRGKDPFILREYLKLRHGFVANERGAWNEICTDRHLEMVQRWVDEDAMTIAEARQKLIDLGELPPTYRYDSLVKKLVRRGAIAPTRQRGARRHGMVATYTSAGCRCDPCTTAHSSYQRMRRAAKKAS